MWNNCFALTPVFSLAFSSVITKSLLKKMLISKRVLSPRPSRKALSLTLWAEVVPQSLLFCTLFSPREFSFINICLGIISTYCPFVGGSLDTLASLEVLLGWAGSVTVLPGRALTGVEPDFVQITLLKATLHHVPGTAPLCAGFHPNSGTARERENTKTLQ